jgi:hypothetical protein
LNQSLLHLEQQFFNLSNLQGDDAIDLILEKAQIFSLQGNYKRVIDELSRGNVKTIPSDKICVFRKLKYEAFIRTNKSFELIAEIKNQTDCTADTSLILLRAMIFLEHERFEDFAKETSKLDRKASEEFLELFQNQKPEIENSRRWLPAWHYQNRSYLSGTTTLFLHAIPPATLTAGVLLAVPVSGVLMAGYLGWRLYGSNKIAIEQSANKNSRQKAVNLLLAGYSILERLNQLTESQSNQHGTHF